MDLESSLREVLYLLLRKHIQDRTESFCNASQRSKIHFLLSKQNQKSCKFQSPLEN